MCGIFGCIITEGRAAPTIHESLKRLEYRGYDSVGITTIDNGTLFTKKETIDANPDMVRRFVRASKRGWVWALDNVPEAIEIVLQVNNKLDRDHQNFEAGVTKELILTDVVRKEGFGWMEKARWEQVMKDMIEQKLLKGPMSIDDVMTTRFLKD